MVNSICFQLVVIVSFSSLLSVLSWDPSAPWTAPNGTEFPYKGLQNDLDSMLRVRSVNNWVTVIAWTSGARRFGLNSFYTLSKYGKSDNYVIAAYDRRTLSACETLNLPCVNATGFTKEEISGDTFTYGARDHFNILYGQRNFTRHVLSLGYHVQGNDIDVVYMRSVRDTVDPIFQDMAADAIFVTEESAPGREHTGYINMINSATFFIKSNSRTISLMEHWIMPEQGANDQVWLNNLRGISYSFCDSYPTCLSVSRRGHAAVYRHPSFFQGGSCIQEKLEPEPCHPRRLYVHYLCGVGWENKQRAWDKLDFWFVDEEGNPMWEDGGGSRGKHAFLPCRESAAWKGMWGNHHPVR